MTRSLALVAFAVLFSQAGEPFKPGKLPKDEVALLQPGLTLRIESGGEVDVRRVRLAAIHVPAGTPASSLVKTGPFTASLSGYVKAPIRSEYQFRLVARGSAELKINGKAILKTTDADAATEVPVELARGYNKVEIAFTSPKSGDATLRVLWEAEGFNLEPLPSDSLFTRGDSAELVAGSLVREGRSLFATHHCSRCHAVPVSPGKDGMPELQQTAPSLEAAGSRFGEKWLRAWIQNPRKLRPQATMPAILHGDVAPQKAADIAAYLMTIQGEAGGKAGQGMVAAGEKLFRSLGCLSCHQFNDPKDDEPFDRLPLFHVNEKYSLDSLRAFLLSPHKYYPWSRMPDFKLSPSDADNLVAYLCDQAKGAVEDGPVGDAGRGKKLFASEGCATCHAIAPDMTIEDVKRRPFPKAEAIGCLATEAEARRTAPDFGFSREKADAAVAFLRTGAASLDREAPAEFSMRQMAALKCNACHRRDGATSRWFQVMEEEGTLPENLPLLTWAGEKLQPEWTQKLLAGGIDHRARPWLKARMPAFPARADLLSLGLTHEHGFGAKETDRPEPNKELAEVGKKLMPQVGGLNCIQCHAVGQTPPTAPFEAPGINLQDAAQRLRYGYYTRWMADPPRIDPTTKMVKLAPDGKMTGLREVFDGDAHRQFDALWHYIQTLR